MGLGTGTVLGSYEIASPLGAGGMGEVYRARDTKLGREVAIKILPESFAQDPERLARFQREAQLLAALNHPHIGGIHGLEDAGATRFLVLEFIDGESLAERLTGAGASGLEVRETLTIARQIVDALEAAHEKGIIHRDLKPANIMLTHDGQVKVLDFGLAKMDAESGGSSGPGALTHSPTLTFAATQAGVILGTAAYMSPEQAKGRAADKRSDVWAFGCVLFEMLTGKRAFDGEDVSDTLAAILRGEPNWNAFPADVTPHVRTIVKRCLAKDRKARIPDFAVVRFLLDEPAAPAIVSEPLRPAAPQSTIVLRAWQAIAVLGLLAALGVGTAWYRSRPAPTVARFLVTAPEKTSFANGGRPGATAAISPDGSKLAFTARDASGKTLLWIRSIDSLSAQPLPGTDDAAYPFWSPDSRTLGYSTRGKLMKVAASGGPPVTLCEFSGTTIVGRGGAWNRDGVIVFSNGPGQPLYRVSSAGGRPSPAWKLPEGQAGELFPSFLPDGHHVLFVTNITNDGAYAIFAASLDTGEMTRLLGADTGAVYAAPGYLLFVRQGTLLAQAFDAKTLAVGGDQFPDLLLQMAERHLGRQPAAIVPIELSQEFDCRQERIMGPGRPKGEGFEQRGRIAADPGIALGGAEQRVGLDGCGQGFDIHPRLNQAGPSDLAVKHVEGVLAGLVGFGERAQRVAEHAQKPSRLVAGVEMAPVLPGLGLGEQAGDQPAKQGDRGIGQLAGQLDQLRRDQRVPAPGVEVLGQPARRHGTLAHQLGPPVRMDTRAALRIKAERPDEA